MNICNNMFNIQNPYLTNMLTMKNLSLLQTEISKRSLAMLMAQKNLPLPILTTQNQGKQDNKKVKVQDLNINMLVSGLQKEVTQSVEETSIASLRKPNLILSNNQDRDIFSSKNSNTTQKSEVQPFLTFLNNELIHKKDDQKHDSESTEALSETSSKSEISKKRRLNELELNDKQTTPIESEKSKREKEINALIEKYNFMISEKKRINKEKRKESKKKRGRLRKLAQDETSEDGDSPNAEDSGEFSK